MLRGRTALAAALGLACSLALVACGSKTGLRVPDASDVANIPDEVAPDVVDTIDAIDVPDVQDIVDIPDVPDIVDAPDVQDIVDIPDSFEACVPGRFVLERRNAEVMLVIDRSSSMRLNLEGTAAPPSRWSLLRDALSTALPPFEATVELGALVFPAVPPLGSTDIRDQCRVDPVAIDVPPALGNSAAILSIFTATGPAGGTPTYEAMTTAGRFLLSRGMRGLGRYMVLATDGGPNCNSTLIAATCACTSRDGAGNPNCSAIPTGAYNCLDDARTLAAIDAALRVGVPTYVIGIDDSMRPDLTDVLNRMAVAGGRPNTRPGAARYYSIRRSEDLAAAFDSIQRTIARCVYVTPSRPDDPDMIAIEVGGMLVSRNASRTDGWDWTDRAFGEITFFGATCDRIAAGAPVVTARVGCNDF